MSRRSRRHESRGPDGKPVGLIAVNDLAREAARSQSKLRSGLLQTLAQICHPRDPSQKAA